MAEAKPDCQKLVMALPQGILGLGPRGEVSQMNPAAGRILGVAPEQAAGRVFAELFADRLGQGEELFKTIASAQAKGTAISGLVIPVAGPGGEERHVALTFTPLAGGESAVVLADVSRQEQVRRHQQKKHDQATSWALRLEQEKKRLEQGLKRHLRLSLLAALAVILIFAGVGFYAWTRTHLASYVEHKFEGSAKGGASGSTYTVRPQPLDSSIDLSGSIQPFETLNLLSPFAGCILEKHYDYGQKVKEGSLLLKLDTSELELKLRDAEVAAIKAQENYQKLKNWKNSDTVLQAQRQVEKAENDLEITRQKLQESQMLYNQGIIPLDEHRSLKEQVLNQTISLSTLKDQLRAAVDKGRRENLLVAKLEKKNADAKLAEIRAQIQKSRIQAPVVGVIIKPAGILGDKKDKSVEVGREVGKGQVLVALGNLERLSVTTQVSELNVAKLHKGQKVVITSFAFPGMVLQGRIDTVSSQASQGDPSTPPTFQVTVTTDTLTPAQREKLRLGMSADLQVQVFYNPKALVVPIQAVHPGSKGGQAVTLAQDRGPGKEVAVKTGITTMDMVEITGGLKPGDVVVLPASPQGG